MFSVERALWGCRVCPLSVDRIFRKEPGHHRGVQIGADPVDDLAVEMNEPAIAIVETKSVPGGGKRMQFDDGPVVLDQDMLHHELRALRQHFVQPGERAGDEVGLGMIMAGQRVRAFDRPVDVVVDVVEECSTVTVLEIFEQVSNMGFDRLQRLEFAPWRPQGAQRFCQARSACRKPR